MQQEINYAEQLVSPNFGASLQKQCAELAQRESILPKILTVESETEAQIFVAFSKICISYNKVDDIPSKELAENLLAQAQEETYVTDERRLLKLLRALMTKQQCAGGKIEAFTPGVLAEFTGLLSKVGSKFILVNSTVWNRILGDDNYIKCIDLVSSQDLMLSGVLCHMFGNTLLSDAYRHPTNRILPVDEIWAIGRGLGSFATVETLPVFIETEIQVSWTWTRRTTFNIVNAPAFALYNLDAHISE